MLYRKYTHEPQCNETLQHLENIQPIQPSKLLEGHAPVVQLLLRPWTPWQHGIRTLPPPSRMRLKISKHPNLAGSTQVPLVPCNMPTKPGSWSIQSSHPTWLLEVIQVTPKIKDGACSYFSSCSPCCNGIAKKAHFKCVHCVHKPKIVSNSSRLADWQEPPCWAVPSFTKSFHKDRAWNMESMVILWWFGNTVHMQIHRNRSETMRTWSTSTD